MAPRRDDEGEGLRALPAPPGRPRGAPTTIELDGQLVRAYAGEPVAVALFAGGVRLLGRSPKYHRPRGLFCASGHCGSCLLRIDGQPSVPSCLVPAQTGLRCERQNAFPDAEIDLLAAADWLFPGGMDHHKLMTGSRLGNELFVKLVRRMGGSGTLPDRPVEHRPPARDRIVDLCVVGAGPAGLAAAGAYAEAHPGRAVLVLDDQPEPGGSLLAEPDGIARADALVRAAQARGVELASTAPAIGVYPAEATDALAPGQLAVARAAGLWRVRARQFLYATGAYDQSLPIPDNDRPGALAARAVGKLAFRWGIAAPRVVIATPVEGDAPTYSARLAAALAERGITVETARADALPRLDLKRDVLAMAACPAPASELPRQHGAAVTFDLPRGGFVANADADGAAAPGVFVTGDVTGYVGPTRAEKLGHDLGRDLGGRR